MSHAAVPQEVREARNITFGLFRLSVGLEQPEEFKDKKNLNYLCLLNKAFYSLKQASRQ